LSSAFFQWLNQTYNAVVNWQNRAGGEEASIKKLGVGYLAATGAALAIGVGAMPLLGKLGISGRLVQLTVPMAAVSVSSVVNLVFTRWEEIVNGVTGLLPMPSSLIPTLPPHAGWCSSPCQWRRCQSHQ
jgi:hypothetical protein